MTAPNTHSSSSIHQIRGDIWVSKDGDRCNGEPNSPFPQQITASDPNVPSDSHDLDILKPDQDGHDELNQKEDLEKIDDDDEPLGYRDYLCDVNIEYNFRGNSGRESFKLKYLPYLITSSNSSSRSERLSSSTPVNLPDNDDDVNPSFSEANISLLGSSSASINGSLSSSVLLDLAKVDSSRIVDVTKASSAFLGNSEHVPSLLAQPRRVVLELISAKLSQSTTYHNQQQPLPPINPINNTNSPRRGSSISPTSYSTPPHSPVNYNRHSRISVPARTPNRQLSRNSSQLDLIQPLSPSGSHSSPLPPSSSKRFVNYTLLIRTLPGLDVYPSVIERRFSDFSLLYQGLKAHDPYGKLVDQKVNFPKKVYIGNYSLANIAERSIEFSRLLDLCMQNKDLQSSIPFASFLLDKELREAHRLCMFGDPDDVQVLIETVYHIELKMYLHNKLVQLTENEDGDDEQNLDQDQNNRPSSTSLERDSNQNRISPINFSCLVSSPNHEDTSWDGRRSSKFSTTSNGNTLMKSNSNNTTTNSNLHQSPSIKSNEHESDDFSPPWLIRMNETAINQRILATFSILVLTYSRGENYDQLRKVVQTFCKLISCNSFLGSLNGNRHYITLKACLSFLLTINILGSSNLGDNLLNESQRYLIENRIVYLDSNYLNGLPNFNPNSMTNGNRTFDDQFGNSFEVNGSSGSPKVEVNLTKLIAAKEFCLFQDGKFNNRQ